MKNYSSVLLAVFILFGFSHSYGQKNLFKQFKQMGKPLPTVRKSTASAAAKIQRAAAQAAQAKKLSLKQQQIAAFDASFLERMATLKNPELYGFVPFTPSVFFIEEMREGEKYLWGVTAAHVLDLLGEGTSLYVTTQSGISLNFPFEIAAKGNAGMADIALLRIKEDISDFVHPIPLAEDAPQSGDMLRSYGFFEGDFHIVPNRRVLLSSPGRIITSFEFGNHERAGACGGPLLNENNELVGIHCGSSKSKMESYAVPVSFLRDLIEAAHNNGSKTRDLVLNGQIIGQIDINEYIYSVMINRRGQNLLAFQLWHEEYKVDYDHLETLAPLHWADELQLLLVKNGTIRTDKDLALYPHPRRWRGKNGTAQIEVTQQPTKRMITVNLKTKEVSSYDL